MFPRPACTTVAMLFFWCLFLAASAANALSVDNVRFGNYPEKTRMVLDLSQITDFRVFALDNPYRLVIDMGTFNWKAGKVYKPPQTGIQDIRQGPLQPGISRIVMDMNAPFKVDSAFLLPKHDSKPDRIVIDFQTANRETFLTQKGTIHGTLSLDDIYTEASLTSTPAAGTPAPENNSSFPPVPKTKPPSYTSEKPLIIIDPGHGGVDPGAIGVGNLYEKNIVLALGKELRKQLLATGRYRVEMTRDTDKFIKLGDRVKIAREKGGDLFVSIHADTIHKPNVHGTSVYTLSKTASDKQTAKLAEKENQADLIAGIDVEVDDQQVIEILFDFVRTETMNQSKYFANTLVEKMKNNNVYLLQNPHRYAGFAVLKAPDIPSVLVEAGFMSNKKEARLLNKASHRKKIARAILIGIDAYFEQIAKNQKS